MMGYWLAWGFMFQRRNRAFERKSLSWMRVGTGLALEGGGSNAATGDAGAIVDRGSANFLIL